ncbi:MAG TPA: alkaline phosphatase family protein [Phycisphaerae bacterium]|nr:alkaline phosphatase family protein [Phycisphaerae bacterium]
MSGYRSALSMPVIRFSLVAVAMLALFSGCAADRPIHVRIDNDIRRPERAVVIFFVDGLGEREFDEALAEGRLPNIATHILARGPRVENAVSCIPSITYAVGVTFITGRLPGHQGVLSNKWFDPSTGRFENYCYIASYQQVDADYASSPTIYEILHDRVSVNIQLAIRRGVTHSIDNWATSGLNWWSQNYTGVDCLVAQQFELVGQRSRWWGRWPDLIMAYFPAIDKVGHQAGPQSDAYKQAVANVDKQIGRICGALKDVGMYERTSLCLVSDHGIVGVTPDKLLDIPLLLERSTGRPVWTNRRTAPGQEAKVLGKYDYAVAVTASRWAAVYPLPNAIKDERSRLASFSAALDQFDAEAASGGIDAVQDDLRSALPLWMTEALAHPAVEMAACSFRRGRVHVFTRDGHALILRTDGPPERHTVYQETGHTVFEHSSIPSADLDGNSDSRAWLRLTAHDRYPDLVPQIAAMFDSERAGNIVFFAADGWDFSLADPYGGHGSILPGEMRVPMAFAGPGLSPDMSIPYARSCDLMPTILHRLRADPYKADDPRIDIDGIDLLPFSNSCHR